MGEAIKGLIVGALLGSVTGLGVCAWLLQVTLLFPGDTMVVGALIGATCGFLWGDDFIDWIKDYWRWFM